MLIRPSDRTSSEHLTSFQTRGDQAGRGAIGEQPGRQGGIWRMTRPAGGQLVDDQAGRQTSN